MGKMGIEQAVQWVWKLQRKTPGATRKKSGGGESGQEEDFLK